MLKSSFVKRTRATGVVIKDDKILLIYREKNGKQYYTFPGGGVEGGETLEEALVRELIEETTVVIQMNKLLYHIVYDDNTEQFFYLCKYVSGEPKLHEDSPEVQELLKVNEIFEPKWIALKELKNLLLFPLEVRDFLIEDLENNFQIQRETVYTKISEKRNSL